MEGEQDGQEPSYKDLQGGCGQYTCNLHALIITACITA